MILTTIIKRASDTRVVRVERPKTVIRPEREIRIVRAGAHIVQAVSGGATAVLSFVIADWTLQGGQYLLDLAHNLESDQAVLIRVVAESGNDVIAFTAVENYTSNKIRCRVPYDPDGRFAGTAIILGVVI